MHKIYLFIDTTQSTNCFLKLFNENFELLIEKEFITQNNLIDLINPELNLLFEKINKSFQDVKKIYLNIGPGVFTGIRVGVSITKTFKSVFSDIEIYTMNSLQLKCQGNGISLIDAKSNKFFIGIYKDNIELIEPKMVNENEKNEYLKKYSNLKVFDINYQYFKEFNSNILKNFKKKEDFLNLEPLYIKKEI